VNLFTLSLAYLRARALSAALNLVLLALGVGTIVVLLLFSAQLEDRLTRDARGIDLVVGAKGSPLQLILSSIYHVDVPTGNIPLAEAEALKRHPLVQAAIPLALGDGYHGFRIVGTEPAYPAHYGGRVAAGRLWERALEATIGTEVATVTGLSVGSTFVGVHGIAGEGAAHGEHPYRVVGILAPTGTVLDRLILTAVDSVWLVHEAHHEGAEGEDHDGHDEHADHTEGRASDRMPHDQDHGATGRESRGADVDLEVTALLIRYASPLAAATLPRLVNSRSALQAASPAFETARLLTLVGVGLDTLRGFGLLLIGTAALGVFVALYNAMQERRYDLALMRSLGATGWTLFRQVLLEGTILAVSGAVLGVALGHGAAELLGRLLPEARAMGLSGLAWLDAEWYLLGLVGAVGIVAAVLPALQAYRTDIAVILAAR
jgi:putative ABC transport system permease protein